MASLNDFFSCVERNPELQKSFQTKFDSLVRKYETLHKNVMYKKVNKVSLIQKPVDTNNILSVLNKLTEQNSDNLIPKIMARCTPSNAASFVEQTLKYASGCMLSPKTLERLITHFVKVSDKNGRWDEMVVAKLNGYIYNFMDRISCLDAVASNERYGEFLDRNVENSHIYGSLQMIIQLCTSESLAPMCECSVAHVFRWLIHKLKENISSSADNMKQALIECIFQMVSKESVMTHLKIHLKEYDSMQFDQHYSSLSNKLKFRIYDINDLIAMKKN